VELKMKMLVLTFSASSLFLFLISLPLGSAQENQQTATKYQILKHDGKPADMTKPVQVFILLGQSNMVGLGKVKGPNGSLEFAVKEKKKYPYLLQDDGKWMERNDVRFVRYMSVRAH